MKALLTCHIIKYHFQNFQTRFIFFEGIPVRLVQAFGGTRHLIDCYMSGTEVTEEIIKSTFKGFFTEMKKRKNLVLYQGAIETFEFFYHLHKICPLYVDGSMLWSLYDRNVGNDNYLQKKLIAIFRKVSKIPYGYRTLMIITQLQLYISTQKYDYCIYWIENHL